MAESVATYKSTRSNDVEIFNHTDSNGSECEARQLSAGPLGCQIDCLELPGLILYCYHYRAAIHFLEKRPHNWLVFMGWFHADIAPNYKGSIVELNDAVISTGATTHEYTIHPNMHSFDIYVKPEIAAQLGWNHNHGSPHIRTPGCSMQQLGIIIRKAFDLAQSWEYTGPSPRTVMTLQNQILKGLKAAMQPWLQHSTPLPQSNSMEHNYQLVKQAEAWQANLDYDETWTAATMAACISVSERTLYRAFKTWANVGPSRYFTLQKLHNFRKYLLSGDTSRGAITRAASASGFDHFGRLSVDYKKLFGEMPSESLQRFSEMHSGYHQSF